MINIATGCNSKYFEAAKTLVYSCLIYGKTSVNEIHIYNLGLKRQELRELSSLQKVKIYSLPNQLLLTYPHFNNPKNFAWKTYIINNEAKLDFSFLYIDSGACFVNHINPIIDIIEKDDVFIVNDIYQTNNKWCHSKSLEILEADMEQRNGNQIWAGMQGYKTNGKFNNIPIIAFEYAKIRECIEGDVKVHRHDQCIYSILTQKYNCPRQDIHTFGEWRGIINPNQIIYVHRGQYKIKPQKDYYVSFGWYVVFKIIWWIKNKLLVKPLIAYRLKQYIIKIEKRLNRPNE